MTDEEKVQGLLAASTAVEHINAYLDIGDWQNAARMIVEQAGGVNDALLHKQVQWAIECNLHVKQDEPGYFRVDTTDPAIEEEFAALSTNEIATIRRAKESKVVHSVAVQSTNNEQRTKP